jgi:rhomboid protease GluP
MFRVAFGIVFGPHAINHGHVLARFQGDNLAIDGFALAHRAHSPHLRHLAVGAFAENVNARPIRRWPQYHREILLVQRDSALARPLFWCGLRGQLLLRHEDDCKISPILTPSPESGDFSRPRNQLLAALLGNGGLESGKVALLKSWQHLAVLAVEGGAQLLVITPGAEGSEHLLTRLRSMLSQQPFGLLLLVVVGGPPSFRESLAALPTSARDAGLLGIYHLDDTNILTHVVGRKLGLVADAGKRLAETEPLDEAGIAAAVERVQRNQVDEERFARRLRAQFPHVSVGIGTVCVLLFFLSGGFEEGAAHRVLLSVGGNSALSIVGGQPWRLLSSAFLHVNSTHLLVNMMSLFVLGTFLEKTLGWARFLLIYGLSALAGSVASSLLGHSNSVGASGAIWGVMLAGYAVALRPGSFLPPVVAARIKRGLTLPLIINTWMSFLPGIDLYAHFGGGAIGLALMFGGALRSGTPLPDGPPPASRLLKSLAIGVAVAMAASTGISLWAMSYVLPRVLSGGG